MNVAAANMHEISNQRGSVIHTAALDICTEQYSIYHARPFAGERYVYKFVCDPDALFNMAAYGSAGSEGGSSSHGLHHARGGTPATSSGADSM